jgi:lipopolysaccharide transport system ATP-binding protein
MDQSVQDPAIELPRAAPGSAFLRMDGVSLNFPIYHGGARSLKKTMLSKASELSKASGRLGAMRASPANARIGGEKASDGAPTGRVVVQALRDITLSLSSGDRLGIVGRNGAGKSSLLRVMAGIYEPVAGRVHVGGTLNALLDANLGMNLDLTGRENITLRGHYTGLGRPAMRRLEEDVQEFAALDEFLDLPVRVYSSGMVIRLGFGLATAIAPQVLLMDEWFMAGDAAFQAKARARLESVVRGAEIMVLTSHQVSVIRTWCTRVLWLEAGRIRADGIPDEVIAQYQAATNSHAPA